MKDDKKRTFRSAGWFARTDKDGLHPSELDARLSAGRVRRAAGHRHLQHVVGADAVQRAFPRRSPSTSSAACGSRADFRSSSRSCRAARRTFGRRRCCSATSSAWTSRSPSAPIPIDGVVLLCGCDKTTPALVMGAASVDLPSIVLSGGAMLNGKFCGQDIGSGTDVWRFSEDVGPGRMSLESFMEAQTGMSRSTGVCMVMGTASTMATMVEALGIEPAAQRGDSRRRFPPADSLPISPAAGSSRWCTRISACRRSSRARRSRTRFASTAPSAARPTR